MFVGIGAEFFKYLEFLNAPLMQGLKDKAEHQVREIMTFLWKGFTNFVIFGHSKAIGVVT